MRRHPRLRLLLLLLAALLGVACAAQDPDPGPQVPPLHPEVDAWPAAVVTISPGPDRSPASSGGDEVRDDVRVDVRVADTPERRRRGLMHVPEVPPGSGVLFVFPRDHDGAFWMLDTLVPLDIAFAGADGTIGAVLTMPLCDTDPCPRHDPGVTYRTALEVPAGWFAEVGVEVGDRMRFTDPQAAGG